MNQRSPWQPRRYNGWLLFLVMVAYLFAVGFLFIEVAAVSGVPSSSETSTPIGILGSTSTVLFIILYIGLFALDARSFLTLFGRIEWRRLKGWQRVGLVVVYLCIVVMPAIYLVQAVQYFLRIRGQSLGQVVHGQWSRYRAKKGPTQLMIGLVSCFVIISVVAFTSVATTIDRQQALLLATPSPALHQIVANNAGQATPTFIPSPFVHTPTPTATHTTTATPRPTSTVHPQATLTARPTQPPHTPTPCPGINCNPWGYNFSPGNLITSPPSNFCAYFNCISSFWEPDDPDGGYVVQCGDGTYSQSGGERGACSYHNGVSRPLYSH